MSYFCQKLGREVCGHVSSTGKVCWLHPHGPNTHHAGPDAVRRSEKNAMARQRKRRESTRAYIVDGNYRDRTAAQKAEERYAGPD